MLKRIVVALLFALALAGAVINFHLARLHTSKGGQPAWFQDICSPEDRPEYDCKEAIKTKWAVIAPTGFVEPDEQGRQPGMPVAILGLWYFTAVALWYLLVGRPSYNLRILHHLLLLLILVGCLVSAFYLWVILYRMDVKCMWCMISHGINFALLLGTLLLIPRRPRLVTTTATVRTDTARAPATQVPVRAPAAQPAPGRVVTAPPPEVPPAGDESLRSYPSLRHGAAAFLAILAVLYGQYLTLGLEANRNTTEGYKRLAAGYKAEIERMLEDPDTQLVMFKGLTPVDIPLRPDDPRRASGEKPLEMVVFSDFECPVCRKFTERLEKELIPFLDHRVALTWKHYPIDQACNPHAVRTLHEHACTAAFAAEAARMQGGNEAFWKAHDKLFADQRRIGEINFEVFAAELGLDPQRFVADMQSEAVKQRIREDAELAHKLQVTGTPAVYIMGRRVRNFLFESKAFLEDLKRSREQEHGAKPEHRPARPRKPEKQEAAPSPADADTTSALPAEPDSSPIPDNPGPPDAE